MNTLRTMVLAGFASLSLVGSAAANNWHGGGGFHGGFHGFAPGFHHGFAPGFHRGFVGPRFHAFHPVGPRFFFGFNAVPAYPYPYYYPYPPYPPYPYYAYPP